MQLRYIVILLLCLTIGLSVSSCPVLASSSSKSEDFTKTDTEETESSHSGGGGQHSPVTDEEIYKTLVAPFKVIWNWCVQTQIHIGSHSFTFAEFFLFQILAGIVIWFIWYRMYYG